MKKAIIIGKGPTLVGQMDCIDKDTIYGVLNTAIKVCNGRIDYHFMNDFENLSKISIDDLNKSKNVVIPTYPHIHEKPCPDMDWKEFKKRMLGYRGTFKLYRLHTAPTIDESIPFLDVRYSVAETATLYFINLGIKEFTYIGVGKLVGYSDMINEEVPSHQNTKWLTSNYNRIVTHLENNNCKWKFK